MTTTRARLAAVTVLALSCTDVGLYAVDGDGAGRPDRAVFDGIACVPPAAGDIFPTKVLFAVQGGEGVSPELVGQLTGALDSIAQRFTLPSVQFGLVAYHAIATGLLGSFGTSADFQAAVIRYASYQEQGPVSVRAPLRLARSILSGDMQASCEGEVARTRYLVVLLVMSPDTSCANPNFNTGLDPLCTRLEEQACAVCELTAAASAITGLAETYRAGEVTVQPIYVQTVVDPVMDQRINEQLAGIASGGGTVPIVVTPESLSARLHSLDYASMQRQLSLKRLLAFNRNVQIRAGEQLADSDGDGAPDADELALGLSPTDPDSDDDHLMDGLERRMGLDPLAENVITACNPVLDTDGDRLLDCEERVLGTNPCMGDTDSDTLPDLVEALAGTNPLVPEDLQDADHDGVTNIDEVLARSDPHSADAAFRAEHSTGYEISPADPTADGRLCYRIRAANIGLAATLERPNPPYANVPAGSNDLYLYFQSGRENDPRGAGVSALRIQTVRFTPPTRDPAGILPVLPDEFVPGV